MRHPYRKHLFQALPVILLLLFSGLSLAAPLIEPAAPGFRPVKLDYENSGGEQGVTLYFYNDHGIMDRAHWQLLDGSRSSENYYTFDRAGHQVRKYREFSDGIISDQYFRYDTDGRLFHETFQRSDSVTGFVDYVYDTKNRLKEADCQGLNGWFQGTIEYTIDQYGRKKLGILKKAGAGIGTITYAYDQHGNMVTEFWDFNGRWTQTYHYTFEPEPEISRISFTPANPFLMDNPEFRIIGEDYMYANETGGPSTYEYDDEGKLIRKIFTRSDGLQTITSYLYDAEGFLLTSHREYSNNLSADFSYEFNGNRKLLKKSFLRSDGLKGYETFEYDGKGRMIKAVYENMDAWLNGTITFIHSDSGLIETGRFTEKDNFNADLQFSYDEHRNLTRIHWIFSFGKTQTYQFEYGTVDEVPAEGE